MKPSIGRIVHFTMSDGEHRPAIITSVVTDDLVGLRVFVDQHDGPFLEGADGPIFQHPDHLPGQYPRQSSAGSAIQPFTWHWPERV